jgi:tetratricopeptide (TPR) repeat protein
MEKALASCERALSLQANLPEGLAARARINYTQHKYDEALGYARQALKLKPDCESANWCLGQAYFASGRFEDAIKVADSVVEAAGDDYNVYVPLLVSADKLGMKERADEFRRQQARMIRQHLDSVPEDVRARILLACNYAATGDAHEAVAELKTAVALRPKDANVLYNAACAYALLRRKQEAIALLTRSKEAGFLNLDWATKDPDLTCLYEEPEFQALISSEKSSSAEQGR